MLITLWLSTTHPLDTAVILLAFIAVAVVSGVMAVRSVALGWGHFEGTLETSAQLAIRVAVVLVFALVALAAELGLDLLLGGFVAGIITRLAVRGREVARFESKLLAVGYGFFIPFFFVFSGVTFDLDAVVGSVSGLLKLPLFVAMFLIVRGLPALLLYREVLDARDRMALAGSVHPASPGRGHHHRGRGAGPHARLHGRGARGRGHHLHADVPAAGIAAPHRPRGRRARAGPGVGCAA